MDRPLRGAPGPAQPGGGSVSRRLAPVFALLTLTFAAPEPAQAWGAAGHRMVGGSGRAHSISLDSGHFLDVYDDGTVMGGPRLEAMPPDREAYETALRAAGTNAWKAGWLYYAILETQQQLTKDLAMWRVLDHAVRTERKPDRKAWFRADLRRREALVLQTIGRLSHYVADGSQPLHVTHHYNGWAEGPNPEGFTRERIHSRFEGELVAAGVRLTDVQSAMPPPGRMGAGWRLVLRPTWAWPGRKSPVSTAWNRPAASHPAIRGAPPSPVRGWAPELAPSGTSSPWLGRPLSVQGWAGQR